MEKQSTNYITYSEQFDNAAWVKNGISLSANQIISPDGTQNADKLTTNDPSGSVYRIYETNSIGSNNVCSVSCYFKYENWQYAYIVAANYSGVGKFAVFDVINGINTFVSTGYTATIESIGNDWYKCCLIGEMGSTSYTQFGIAPTSTAYNNISIANGKNLYLWGTQREISSYPTSYIPTTSASATRVADACSKTGISSLIGQSQGTIFVDVIYDANILSISGGSDQPIIAISDGTFQNYISLLLQGSNDNRVIAYCITSGVSQALILSSAQTSGTIKIAVSYNSNYFALFVNGVKIGQDTSISIPATNSLNIGSYLALGSQFNTNLKETALWKVQLTDAECIALTTI